MRSDIKKSLDMYRLHHRPTGGFLYAVLTNDFMKAIGKADGENIRCLREIRDYILTNMPSRAYGNKERVEAWLQ